MRVLKALALLAPVVLAGGCTQQVGLNYAPPEKVSFESRPMVAAVTATDQRREAPNRLATIMGTFGNPLKILDTSRPVKDEVAAAFAAGLRARGLLGPETAPIRVALLIRKFDADMIMGSTARIDLDLTLLDANGRELYRDSVQDEDSEMHFLGTGVLADPEGLRLQAEKVLNRTVDRMLDKPEFRAAVARAGG